MTTIECDKKTQQVLNNYNILENRLLKEFLENKENLKLFENAIKKPTKENKQKVEEAFQAYYSQIRKFSFINSLIRIYSNDFEKRIRKLKERYSLVLDQPISTQNEASDTYKNLYYTYSSYEENYDTLINSIGNEDLHAALKLLTDFQYKILELIYIKNLTVSEIAKIEGTSPQNISNTHKKAIKKIKKYMEGEKNEYR